MNDEISTSTGGTATKSTSGGSTPFSQIQELEAKEAARLQQEIDGMDAERLEVEKAVAEKEEAAEHDMKNAAREELKEYRESQLTGIISTAEKEAVQETDALESSYSNKEDGVAKDLLNSLIQDNSPILS